MKKIIALVSMITLFTLTGWSSIDLSDQSLDQISSSSTSDDATLTSRGYFDCTAIGKCSVVDGGGSIRHFANWSGNATDRPAAIDKIKEEWYRTAKARGCTKDFEIILVSCQ